MGGNATYSSVNPRSVPDRVGNYQRRKLFAAFMKTTESDPPPMILDVGVSSANSYFSSNYLEALYPHKSQITTVAIDDASFLQKLYPGLRFLQADGLALPFADDSFDVVH